MYNSEQIPIVVVLGPTASGKTKLAVDIAKKYDGEVISADSMQIYKYLSVGTAKPTKEEMQNIPHHLIDFVEPDTTFSVAQFCKLAKEKIAEISSRGKLPIIAGGTGLYINSLIENVAFSHIGQDEEIRNELYDYAKVNGNEKLFEQLLKIDPEISKSMHYNNLPRVVRAIEIYRLTGENMTSHVKKSKLKPTEYNSLLIGLNYTNRQTLYDRINYRVDLMMENGLLEEAKELFGGKYSGTALQAIGYKEFYDFLYNDVPLIECVDKIKMESRRYAKRQLTWFRRNEAINWLYIDEIDSYEELFSRAKLMVQKHLSQ